MDEIELLRTQNRELIKALLPFSELGVVTGPDSNTILHVIRLGWIRDAKHIVKEYRHGQMPAPRRSTGTGSHTDYETGPVGWTNHHARKSLQGQG